MYICLPLSVEFLETVAFEMSCTECLCRHPRLPCAAPGACVTPCQAPESCVPQCWGGYCPMCQPDGICYPLQMESAPAGRRKLQYLELLWPSNYCFLGCSCDGRSVPWWMIAGGWWAAGVYGDVLGDAAAARMLLHHWLLCCAGGGTPAPASWASVPWELPTALFPIKVNC